MEKRLIHNQVANISGPYGNNRWKIKAVAKEHRPGDDLPPCPAAIGIFAAGEMRSLISTYILSAYGHVLFPVWQAYVNMLI